MTNTYTIEVGNGPFGAQYTETVRGKNNAAQRAREICKVNQNENVYVSFSRRSDGQQGYLTPCGAHSPVGENWN